MVLGEAVPDREEWDDGRIVFHYSREHRLNRASDAVRELNETSPPPKRGLFRTLTSTRPLTLAFLSIVTACAAMILYSLTAGEDSISRLRDLEIKISALKSSGRSYLTVVKKIKGGDPYTGAADFLVAPADETFPAHAERLYFTLEKEEVFRFSVPFGGKLLILAVLDEDKAAFKISPR